MTGPESSRPKPLKIGDIELANRVFLAPMSGVTDAPFRRLTAALGAGLGIGLATGSQSAPGVIALTGQLHKAIDPATGVTGTVGLVAKAWGTQVTLDLAGVHGPVECQLIAVSKTGEQKVVTAKAEAEAFASMVRAKQFKPPLAVGIFGDWGSGKSLWS